MGDADLLALEHVPTITCRPWRRTQTLRFGVWDLRESLQAQAWVVAAKAPGPQPLATTAWHLLAFLGCYTHVVQAVFGARRQVVGTRFRRCDVQEELSPEVMSLEPQERGGATCTIRAVLRSWVLTTAETAFHVFTGAAYGTYGTGARHRLGSSLAVFCAKVSAAQNFVTDLRTSRGSGSRGLSRVAWCSRVLGFRSGRRLGRIGSTLCSGGLSSSRWIVLCVLDGSWIGIQLLSQ